MTLNIHAVSPVFPRANLILNADKDEYKNIREKLEAKKVILSTPVERIKTEGEILQQKILAEYDELYKTLGVELAGVRHLKINEDFMQIADYLEFRYLQELDKLENPENEQ